MITFIENRGSRTFLYLLAIIGGLISVINPFIHSSEYQQLSFFGNIFPFQNILFDVIFYRLIGLVIHCLIAFQIYKIGYLFNRHNSANFSCLIYLFSGVFLFNIPEVQKFLIPVFFITYSSKNLIDYILYKRLINYILAGLFIGMAYLCTHSIVLVSIPLTGFIYQQYYIRDGKLIYHWKSWIFLFSLASILMLELFANGFKFIKVPIEKSYFLEGINFENLNLRFVLIIFIPWLLLIATSSLTKSLELQSRQYKKDFSGIDAFIMGPIAFLIFLAIGSPDRVFTLFIFIFPFLCIQTGEYLSLGWDSMNKSIFRTFTRLFQFLIIIAVLSIAIFCNLMMFESINWLMFSFLIVCAISVLIILLRRHSSYKLILGTVISFWAFGIYFSLDYCGQIANAYSIQPIESYMNGKIPNTTSWENLFNATNHLTLRYLNPISTKELRKLSKNDFLICDTNHIQTLISCGKKIHFEKANYLIQPYTLDCNTVPFKNHHELMEKIFLIKILESKPL